MTRVELSDDQQLLQETTRRFLEATCPLAEVRRVAQEVPAGFERAWWRRAAELGWTGLLVPEAFGGSAVSGSGVADLALVAEEMGRAVAPGPLAPVALAAADLAAGGSAAVRDRWLGPLLAGEAVAAWCREEPGAWDGSGGGCRLEPDGSGGRLVGTKGPVEAGAEADVLVVTATAGDRLVQVVVPADAAGVQVEPLTGLDLVRRHATVSFDGVAVPGDAVLAAGGPAGAGGGAGTGSADTVPAAGDLLPVAVLVQCAEMVGAAAAMLERTLAYAFDRYSFGRPLASYQALKHRFADMTMWLHASQALARGAARALDEARAGLGDPAAASELVHAAKLYAGEHVPRLLQDCVQLNGGIGVTWEHDLHLYLRRAVADRNLLGLPADHAECIAAGLPLHDSPEEARMAESSGWAEGEGAGTGPAPWVAGRR